MTEEELKFKCRRLSMYITEIKAQVERRMAMFEPFTEVEHVRGRYNELEDLRDYLKYFPVEGNYDAVEKSNAKVESVLQYGPSDSVPCTQWSGDDEQLLGFIYDLLNCMVWRKDWAMSKEECLKRLESLKPMMADKIPLGQTGSQGYPGLRGISALEAAEEYVSKTLCDSDDGPSTALVKDGFIAGAKWQKDMLLVD